MRKEQAVANANQQWQTRRIRCSGRLHTLKFKTAGPFIMEDHPWDNIEKYKLQQRLNPSASIPQCVSFLLELQTTGEISEKLKPEKRRKLGGYKHYSYPLEPLEHHYINSRGALNPRHPAFGTYTVSLFENFAFLPGTKQAIVTKNNQLWLLHLQPREGTGLWRMVNAEKLSHIYAQQYFKTRSERLASGK